MMQYVFCSGKDKMYQEKLKSQRNLAKQLMELEKTLQFSRKDSEAYTSLEDAYDEEVEVSDDLGVKLKVC